MVASLIPDYARRMADRGHPVEAIALRYGIAPADVARILERRAIKGALARKIRLRHGCGWTPGRIAEALHCDPADVAGFLAPPPPPARPARTPRPSPRWSGWSDGDATPDPAGGIAPPATAASPAKPPAEARRVASDEEWGNFRTGDD